VLDATAATSHQISARGAAFLTEACGSGPLAVHTHCNTGSLACLGWGTALGVIRALHVAGALSYVIVDETRPLLQGARLTCWELGQLGIEHQLACDGAAPFLISQGRADAVVVGADRIAANGDVANKIGTYSLALAARQAGIPFLVAAPESTIDQARRPGRRSRWRGGPTRRSQTRPRRPVPRRSTWPSTSPRPSWSPRWSPRTGSSAAGNGRRDAPQPGGRSKLSWRCRAVKPQAR